LPECLNGKIYPGVITGIEVGFKNILPERQSSQTNNVEIIQKASQPEDRIKRRLQAKSLIWNEINQGI
jgi:hypothetical protein